MSEPEWLPVAEVARRWGVRVDYVRRLARRRQVARRHVGGRVELDWRELCRRFGTVRRMQASEEGDPQISQSGGGEERYSPRPSPRSSGASEEEVGSRGDTGA